MTDLSPTPSSSARFYGGPLATPMDAGRSAHHPSSPSYFLQQSLGNATLNSSPLSSPRVRSPAVDVTTPKSCNGWRGLNHHKSPYHASAKDSVIGTAAEEGAGSFAAAMQTQMQTPFNLPSLPGMRAPRSRPVTPEPASPSKQRCATSSPGLPPRTPKATLSYGGPLSQSMTNNRSLPPSESRECRASIGRPKTAEKSPHYAPILSKELSRHVLDEATLILDLRPHAVFTSSAGHLANSINICVPTTLLRRATYGLARIAETLSRPERHRLVDNLTAYRRIVALDQDSMTLQADGMLASILAKFAREGFKGHLCWLKGGFHAFQTSLSAEEFSAAVVTLESSSSTNSSQSSSLDLAGSSWNSSSSLSSTSSSSSLASEGEHAKHSSPILQCRNLPASAFQAASTQQFRHDQTQAAQRELNAYFGDANGDQFAKSASGKTRTAANPFFDNIRQCQESLDLDRSLQNLQPFEVPAAFETNAYMRARLPEALQELVKLTPQQRAERLGREFFEIEEREQHRLQDLLSWHASRDQQSHGLAQDSNPLSISAGVEKGHLNRYRNVFPFEHTRVRLNDFAAGESDYVNASRIDLRGSRHAYIATQGPLASSFNDFWQLVYQEEVVVIVMLTNLREAGREKCGAYFRPGRYGKLDIATIDRCHAAAKEDEALSKRSSGQMSAGGFFGAQTPTSESGIIRRTFRIQHADHPGAVRYVRHLHFASWPDFDVPPNSADVLSLIREVNEAKHESSAPVVVHCSAGVGRTGCFIAIDTVLESLLHRCTSPVGTPMDVEADPSHGGLLMTRSRTTPPLWTQNPIQGAVDEMREQRMSMLANQSQYRFAYTSILDALANAFA